MEKWIEMIVLSVGMKGKPSGECFKFLEFMSFPANIIERRINQILSGEVHWPILVGVCVCICIHQLHSPRVIPSFGTLSSSLCTQRCKKITKCWQRRLLQVVGVENCEPSHEATSMVVVALGIHPELRYICGEQNGASVQSCWWWWWKEGQAQLFWSWGCSCWLEEPLFFPTICPSWWNVRNHQLFAEKRMKLTSYLGKIQEIRLLLMMLMYHASLYISSRAK
jgi:hypothetical protein